MNVYEYLARNNPTALVRLDSYQMECHGCHIEKRELDMQPIKATFTIEPLTEISKEMSQAPHSPAELRSDE